MDVPPLAEIDNSVIYVGIGAGLAGLAYCCWQLAHSNGQAWLSYGAGVAVALLGPLKFGWPVDTSVVIGGAVFTACLMVRHLTGRAVRA